jgi:anti-sigma factor RsiW
VTIAAGSAEEMVCIELVELVTAYLEDRLPTLDRERFDEHLSACGPCRNYVEQFRETIALSGRVAVDDVAAEDRAAFVRMFEDWRAAGPG